MKKLLTLVLLSFSITIFSQTLKSSIKIGKLTTSVNIPVNKVFNLDIKQPKTEQQCLSKAEPTTNTAQYKQQNYSVYATTKGKLFIVVPNKENTGYYRKYIKTEE